MESWGGGKWVDVYQTHCETDKTICTYIHTEKHQCNGAAKP